MNMELCRQIPSFSTLTEKLQKSFQPRHHPTKMKMLNLKFAILNIIIAPGELDRWVTKDKEWL